MVGHLEQNNATLGVRLPTNQCSRMNTISTFFFELANISMSIISSNYYEDA